MYSYGFEKIKFDRADSYDEQGNKGVVHSVQVVLANGRSYVIRDYTCVRASLYHSGIILFLLWKAFPG